ncbi:hypothetical protein [Streptomyces sp. NPDC059076]|uniref:hypothetical protein n=1 Tax=unclassified Streptomyces TaxID=2593676 RepID=UPI003681CCF0
MVGHDRRQTGRGTHFEKPYDPRLPQIGQHTAKTLVLTVDELFGARPGTGRGELFGIEGATGGR